MQQLEYYYWDEMESREISYDEKIIDESSASCQQVVNFDCECDACTVNVLKNPTESTSTIQYFLHNKAEFQIT